MHYGPIILFKVTCEYDLHQWRIQELNGPDASTDKKKMTDRPQTE